MLIATHEMGFAREVADRVCFLHEGRLLEVGPPEQVLDDPQRAGDEALPAPAAGGGARVDDRARHVLGCACGRARRRMDRGQARAQWGPEIKTLGEAAREFAKRHSPWMIGGAIVGAGRRAGADRRAPDLARRGRGRGDARRLSVRRVGDPRLPAAREADRAARPPLRAADHPRPPLPPPPPEQPDDPAARRQGARRAAAARRARSWSLVGGLPSGWSPARSRSGRLVSAAIAGYVLVGVYEWTHYLIHTAYRPRSRAYRRSGATTACTTSRTSTTGTGSPTRSPTGCSAPTRTSARSRARETARTLDPGPAVLGLADRARPATAASPGRRRPASARSGRPARTRRCWPRGAPASGAIGRAARIPATTER